MNRVLFDFSEELLEQSWFSKIEQFMQKVLLHLEKDFQELSVYFCNDSIIQNLNKEYRNIDSATDVLSFEGDDFYEDENGKWNCLGDIVISLETLKKNCEYFNEDIDVELKRLLVHGLLHLIGMDHGEEHIQQDKTPECFMLVLQEQILQTLKDEKLIDGFI